MANRLFRRLTPALTALILTACAGGADDAVSPDAARQETPEKAVGEDAAAMAQTVDPWRGYNMGMHKTNRWIDRTLLDPVANAYNTILPQFVRTRITNVFNLLDEPLDMIHNILQGRPGRASRNASRIVVNASIGLGGLFDVASQQGIERANEDAGQTLAVWGVPSGPYVVLPLFGPSTVRDAAGIGVDIAGDPMGFVIDGQFGVQGLDLDRVNNGLTGGEILQARADRDSQVDQIYGTDDLDASYTLMRTGFLQSRCFAITNNRLGAGCQEEEDMFDTDLDDMRRDPREERP